MLEIKDNHGSRRLCPGGDNEHVVITKNTGEPFSLTGMRLNMKYNTSGTNVVITGYVKGSSTRKQMTVWVPDALDNASTANAAPTFSGWDNFLKVEIRTLGNMICVDDIGLTS